MLPAEQSWQVAVVLWLDIVVAMGVLLLSIPNYFSKSAENMEKPSVAFIIFLCK